MAPMTPRIPSLLAAGALLITGTLAAAAPVAAAGSPQDTVNALFDAVNSGDSEAMAGLVCEADREAVLRQLDPATALGLEGDLADAFRVRVDDRSVELVSQDETEATVHVTGSSSFDIEPDRIPELAQAVAVSQLGADASQEEIDMVAPMLEGLLTRTIPVDEDLTLVNEDGQWLVCGAFLGIDDTGPATEATVSGDGLCALATPEELSSVTRHAYDSSFGIDAGPEQTCNYSTSDFESYYSANVDLQFNQDAETYAGYFDATETLEVGGAPAWSTGDADYHMLLTQLGSDLLSVTISLPEAPADGVSWQAEAQAITEFFMPRISTARAELAPATPEPTPEPTPEISLCESLPVADLNALTGISFDQVEGDSSYCSYLVSSGDPGFHFVAVSLVDLPLRDLSTYLPDATEATVSGQPALEAGGQLIVGLPDGVSSLTVSGAIDPSDESVTMTDEELRQLVAERFVAALLGSGQG